MKKRLPKDMSNEAAWVYLRGLYNVKPASDTPDKFKRVPLSDIVNDLRPLVEPLTENRFAVMCMADIHQVENDLQSKIKCYERLRDDIDKIRRNYWQYLLN